VSIGDNGACGYALVMVAKLQPISPEFLSKREERCRILEMYEIKDCYSGTEPIDFIVCF